MGFSDFGHNSFKQNRALRQDKEPFQRMKENYFLTPKPVTFKSYSPEKIEEIKRRFLKNKKREKMVEIIALLLSILMVGWLLFLVLFSKPSL